MTLAPHDQVTLDRITGIMPDRFGARRWVREIARRGERSGPPEVVAELVDSMQRREWEL